MSNEAIGLVNPKRWGSTTRKVIALQLANYADADWGTFVGQVRLAAETETSERTVRRVLADFEAEGLIVRERRYRADGTRTSDRIILVPGKIELLPDNLAGNVDYRPTTTRLPATDDTTTGQSLTGEPLEEPSEEPSDIRPTAAEPDRVLSLVPSLPLSEPDLFEKFWQAYPRRRGASKQAAKKAWLSAIKKEKPLVIIQYAERYANSPGLPEERFRPHAATWLNQQRWLDQLPDTSPEPQQPAKPAHLCRKSGCSNPIAADGMCTGHIELFRSLERDGHL